MRELNKQVKRPSQKLISRVPTEEIIEGETEQLKFLRQHYLEIRHFEEVNFDQFKSLSTNKDNERRIRLILEQYEYLKWNTTMVPSSISLDLMNELLHVDSTRNREKVFALSFQKEMDHFRAKELRKIENQEIQKKLEKRNQHKIGRAGRF